MPRDGSRSIAIASPTLEPRGLCSTAESSSGHSSFGGNHHNLPPPASRAGSGLSMA
jgi:hypothetical protein